jgi:formate hydrogenlyase transcriptional activator
MSMDHSAELVRLRATVRDLLALSAIPEVWVGREPPALATELADLLIESLHLDFAFVRLCDPEMRQTVEAIRGDAWSTFPEWLQQRLAVSGHISHKEVVNHIRRPDESFSGIVIPIGVNGERGLVAAAFYRLDFPNETDRQLLSVAAKSAGTAFRSAHLINELRSAQKVLRDREQELRTARDELEIKVAERTSELRRSERELRQILDLAPQLVAVIGPQGDRLFANRVLLEMLGLTFEEWRNRPFPSLSSFHPDDRERFASVFETGFTRGAPTAFEVRVGGRDGTFRWFLVHHNPLRDDHGRITRWYLVATDIDDRKRAEHKLQQENIALREEIDKTSMFEEIVGTSPPLRAALSHVAKVAPTDSTVLITGETGTGKELIARAIHKRSPRSARAFVAVNCAAIPSSLIASELFGHEKGAFTGALQRRQGRFELADGGTLFLDEVAELPAETQIMLLRVLQEREFERVGGSGPVRVNVRVIAATNRDLHAAVADSTFRADLFYRLNVFPLDVPALRDRRSDVPLLVEYFTHRYAKRLGKRIRRLTKETSQLLQAYDWPGNIRELQNVIERAVIVCDSDTLSIEAQWLSGRSPGPAPAASLSTGTLATHEKDAIEAALKDSKGRVAGPLGAAGRLGVPASTLESKIKALQIDKRRFKPG